MLAAVLFLPFVSYCFMEEVLRDAHAHFCIRLSVPHEKKTCPEILGGRALRSGKNAAFTCRDREFCSKSFAKHFVSLDRKYDEYPQ